MILPKIKPLSLAAISYLFLFLTMVFASAHAVNSEPLPQIPPWELEFVPFEDGALGVCLGSRTSGDDLYVIGVGGQGRAWLWDIYPSHNVSMHPSRDYIIKFAFDKSRVYHLQANAVNDKLIRVTQLDSAILREIARSYQVDIDIGSHALPTLTLTGTSKLINALDDCYKQYIEAKMSLSAKREQRLGRVRRLNAEVNNLINQGLIEKALPIAEEARVVAGEIGVFTPETAFSHNNLALVYANVGRSEEAAKLYKHALEIMDESLGSDHFEVATTLYNLATLYGSIDRHSEAQALLERAVSIRMKTNDGEPLQLALMLSELGIQYQAQGVYEKATSPFLKALEYRERVLGKSHPDVALALHSLAINYSQMGLYNDALPLYKKALAILEEKFGRNNSDVIRIYGSIAEIYSAQGRYSESERFYKRAIDIDRHKPGNESRVAMNFQGLANLYLKQARYAEAESLYRDALEIARAQSSDFSLELSYILNGFGSLKQATGEYKEAELFFEQALALKKEIFGPESPEVAAILNNVAGLNVAQGFTEMAIRLGLNSYNILEGALGESHPDAVLGLNNLALYYTEAGRYAEAEQALQDVLRRTESKTQPYQPTFALALGNLAGVFARQGRYQEAVRAYEKSITIQTEGVGEHHPSVLVLTNNLAVLYDSIGQHEDAVASFERVLEGQRASLGPRHPDVATALNNLATAYVAVGRYAEAGRFHKEALTLREEVLGENHPDFALSLNNMATLYYKQKRYADAASLLHRAISIRKSVLPREHSDIATSLNNLAWVYRDSRSAISLVSDSELDDFEKPLRKEVLEIHAARLLSGVSGEQGEGLTSADRRGHVLPYLQLLARAKLELEGDVADAVKAIQLGRRLQNSEAYELVAQRVATNQGSQVEELIRERQDLARRARHLQSVMNEWYSVASNEPAARALEDLEVEYESLIEQQKALSLRLGRQSPSLAELEGRRLVDFGAVQAALSAGEAALAWVLGDEESYLLIIRSEGLPSLKALELSESVVARKVEQLHRALDLGDPEHYGEFAAFPASLSADLFIKLFGSSWQSELKGISRLLLVPEGPLTQLSFPALLTEEPHQVEFGPNSANYGDAPWLVRRFAVSILPSLSALTILREELPDREAAEPFLGIGDPLLDDHPAKTRAIGKSGGRRSLAVRDVRNASRVHPSGASALEMRELRLQRIREQPSLPDTAVELHRIAELLDAEEGSLLLREAATELRVKQTSLRRYGTLSFATHGVLAGELGRGIEPGLILTPPAKATDTDDGFLSLSEVAALDLNANWVVLSACNTAASAGDAGNGGAGGGEGLTGLAKAFTYAGARALLVSQWSVASATTVELMEKLFLGYRDMELSRAEAHRSAMLTMLEADDPLYRHPSIWAPFVLVGDGR
jgi:tetratricopeptide (TPR) repeat protein/CHAT domain-containing protein